MIPKKYLGIFVMLASCFALWGLLNNMTDNLVPSFQKIFMTSQSTAGFVQISFYGAYSVIAILASLLIQKKGYRVGVLVGLGVYCLGALTYVPAAIAQSFWTFIVGIFVVAGGCAVLETTCNPYVLALGDEATAVRRLNFAQMFNPVGSFAGIFLAQQLILANLNPATVAERKAMAPEALDAVVHHELFWVCVPYVAVCAVAAAIWVFFFVSKPTEIDRVEADTTSLREIFGILFHSPKWYCGVIAQIFYVGVQIAAWTWTNVYCQKELGVTPKDAASYYLIAFSLFMVARWITTWLMKWFEPAKMMALFALGAVAASFGVVYLPSNVLFSVCGLPFSANVICLCAMSGFMSLMFPTIYGIGLGGIDPKAHKLGAAGLIMAIVGGALLTPWMAAIIDKPGFWASLVPMYDATVDPVLHASSVSLRASFFVPVICFAVVGLYAICFSERSKFKEIKMKKMLFAAVAACSLAAFAGEEYPELPLKITDETPAEKEARMAWWKHDRFGMFIHFGVYAMPARHEWIKQKEAISDKKYDEYVKRFDPDLFDATEWAETAKRAGMKYIVLTTKHHDGFCMWDTKETDYKITKTPFGRDLVKEYVEACREAGLKVGFYFSIKDWHHPDYTVDATHPIMKRFREKEGLKGEALKAAVDKINANRSMDRYRKFMFAQVRELLTNYGKIDIIWYDYTCKNKEYGRSYKDWDAVNLVKLTKRLQPQVLIDNRLDLLDTDDGWDFVTPEQFKSREWPTIRGKRVPWETCQTFSGSWGYYRDEETWKSMPQLIELLTETVSKGGNLIMNVGPTARGEFDWRAQERLEGFAEWMHYNSRSIYGCTAAPEGFAAPNGTSLTYNPETNRIYIHLDDYPMGFLPIEWADKIEYAQFLHDASELFIMPPRKGHSQSGNTAQIGGLKLPVKKPGLEAPVIEIWLKKLDD